MKKGENDMDFDKSELALLKQAEGFQPNHTKQGRLWICVACVVVGSICGALTKPNAVEAWAFALLTISGFGGVIQFHIFRMRALAIIHKLRSGTSLSVLTPLTHGGD